jgi:TRAP-type C4-dicarboxylate transport system permease small subunit
MSHVPPDGEQPRAALPARVLTAIGSLALLVAMATDSIAVVGRHLRVPLLGSIEIVQACVVLAASAATIGTTLAGGHMVVTLVVERLSAASAARLRRLADFASMAFFAATAAGSIWLAIELWNEHELSETVGIPIRWLRAIWCASALAATLIFLRDAWRPRGSRR